MTSLSQEYIDSILLHKESKGNVNLVPMAKTVQVFRQSRHLKEDFRIQQVQQIALSQQMEILIMLVSDMSLFSMRD